MTVTVNCSHVRGGTSVPLFDVAGFADSVAWTLVANGADDKKLALREDNGKLMLDVMQDKKQKKECCQCGNVANNQFQFSIRIAA